jgi:hypothetical protein
LENGNLYLSQLMRDNHEGMPEFISAFGKDGHYFAVLEVTFGEESRQFKFGVSHESYLVIKRVLQTRLFDMMPGVKYRYFYGGSCRLLNSQSYEMTVRIEQEKSATSKQFELTKDLHSNLLWFSRLKSLDDALYLEAHNNEQ